LSVMIIMTPTSRFATANSILSVNNRDTKFTIGHSAFEGR